MTEPEILAKIVDILATQFTIDKAEVNEGTGPEDIEAWDSLTHVTLTAELESAFSVSFEIDEIMEMENVASMLRLIAAKLK